MKNSEAAGGVDAMGNMSTGQTPACRRRAYLPVLLLFIMGIAASVTAYRAINRDIRAKIVEDFEAEAQERAGAITHVLTMNLLKIESLAAFYEGSRSVERNEFKTFVDVFLSKKTGMCAFEWVPVVKGSERNAFEAEALSRIAPNLRIWEATQDGKRAVSAQRDECFPVCFVEPEDGNQSVIGFDMGSLEEHRRLLLESAEAGETRTIAGAPLIELNRGGAGLIICKAVWQGDKALNVEDQREDNVDGFVIGLAYFEEIVSAALGQLVPGGIDIDIYDASVEGDGGLLFEHRSRLAGAAEIRPRQKDARMAHTLVQATTFDVASREWRIECRAIPAFVANRNSSYAGVALGSGLVLTISVCGYLWLLMRGARRNRRLNEELSTINESLTTEVSHRQNAESQLRRYAADLEERNEEAKRFAYVVSHDLRAPLVNLKGFTGELLEAMKQLESGIEVSLPHVDADSRKELQRTISEDIPEALKFITSSVDRMDGFINALLKLSRIAHRSLTLERVNVAEVASDIVSTLAQQIEERGAEVVIEDLPDVVADPVAIRQVIDSLLKNAVIYLDPERPGRIVVSGSRNDQQTIISVSDNGRGIAADDMEKVFAPFRRAGANNVPGEGMGMAYVQAVIRRHGGEIRCESEAGVGTTFTFSLPAPELEVMDNE